MFMCLLGLFSLLIALLCLYLLGYVYLLCWVMGYGLCLFAGLCGCINKADLKKIDAPARLL